jgi:hypothetical protein
MFFGGKVHRIADMRRVNFGRSSALVPLLMWQICLLIHKYFVLCEMTTVPLVKIVSTPLPIADGISNRTTSECDPPPCWQAIFCGKQRLVQQKIQLAHNRNTGCSLLRNLSFGQTIETAAVKRARRLTFTRRIVHEAKLRRQ